VQVDLGLSCSANDLVLRRLAECLPAAALGFRSGNSDRAKTAQEYLLSAATEFCTFNGKLTEHVLPFDAFALIERLLDSPASAIRSTHFSVNVENIHWKGAPPASSGSLNLFDLKAFNRVARFSLSANCRLPADDAGSKDIKGILKRITDETGLGFESARLIHLPGENTRIPEHARAILDAQICFDEALKDAASQFTKQWFSEFAPSALARNDGFKRRMADWGSQHSTKVNFNPLLKRAMKGILPDLRFHSANGEAINFCKPLERNLEILVAFEKALPRIGKACGLWIGIWSRPQALRITANVFRLSGSTEERIWVYNNSDEADETAREAATLTKEILPRFEIALREKFASWPEQLPRGVEEFGNLTAREAFKKAEPLAKKMFSDSELIRLSNHPRSLQVRDLEGPELNFDGRLNRNALWWFHFYSARTRVSFEISVPSVGHIRVLDHGEQYADSEYILNPVGDDWIDSDQVLALTEQRGGRDRRQSGKMFGLLVKLEKLRSPEPYWGVMYGIADERGRNDLIVHLDASTGEPITDIRGF